MTRSTATESLQDSEKCLVRRNRDKNFYGVWCCIPDSYDSCLEIDPVAFYENANKLYAAGVKGVVSPFIVGQIDKITPQEQSIIAGLLSKASSNANAYYAMAICCENMDQIDEYVDAIKPHAPDAVIVQVSATHSRMLLHRVCELLPSSEVYHFNRRAYTLLTGSDYTHLQKHLPSNFAGSLSNYTDYLNLTELFIHSGQCSHFTGEFTMVQGAMLGSTGVLGSLAAINPHPFVKIMALCELKKWDEALKIQNRIISMFYDTYFSTDLQHHTDAEADLALAIAGGFLRLENRLRQARCVDDRVIQSIALTMREKYNDLISH
jgi:dihydrodipicolinate synthase/N-acetylneuraminate lyase